MLFVFPFFSCKRNSFICSLDKLISFDSSILILIILYMEHYEHFLFKNKKEKLLPKQEKRYFFFWLALPALSLNCADANAEGFVELNPHQNGHVAVLSSENGVAGAVSVHGNGLHSANILQVDDFLTEVIVDSTLNELSSLNVQHDFVPPKNFYSKCLDSMKTWSLTKVSSFILYHIMLTMSKKCL